MIYALITTILMVIISKLLSDLLSFDIYILLFVSVLYMLSLIWYKINVDNGDKEK